jgi:hypothetical protein
LPLPDSPRRDRRLAARHPLDHAAHRSHRRRVADQFRPAGTANFLTDRQVDRRLDERPQLIERHRFRQVVEGTQLERLDSVLHAAMRRNDGNRQFGMALRHHSNERQPFTVRQAHVGQAKAVGLGCQ